MTAAIVIPCPECEDGQCPCGTGCPSCLYTRQCSECLGLNRLEIVPEKPRSSRYKWCGTCSRHTRHHPEQPDYVHLRTARPNLYTKMMTLERCCGCHAPFQNSGNRPYGYRLQEAQ